VWALILAVTLYPLHQALARKIGGRQGLAATVLVIAGGLLIVVPSALLVSSFGSSVGDFARAVQDHTLEVRAPRESVRDWPLVGDKLYDAWSRAHDDLPAVLQSMQPKLGEVTKKALAIVASIGMAMLQFLASFIVAGIVLAYGDAGVRGNRAVSERIMGRGRGESFAKLSTTTIRAVAQGVIGIAFVQALLVGLALLVAGVPFAGVLAGVTLVVSIAQVPALLVTLPAIGYIWSSGGYGTAAAVTYTVILLLSGMVDNLLKPILLARGVDAPMPVILLGALGGMATGGILGMFVGAALLALGYEIFMRWVATDPDVDVDVDAEADAAPG
jgi:predicted PurR-regulated permease PerM